MALDKTTLVAALKIAFGSNNPGLDAASQSSIEQMAQQIADAVDTFVKSGTVNSVVTIPVTGSPGSPSAGTATGTVT